MKKNCLLLALLFLCSFIRAWEGNIQISTPNTTLLLHASEGGDLRFSYYGDRLPDNKGYQQIYDTWNGLNRPAYPVFGTTCNEETALQVVHADGNLTLDLMVKDVKEEKLNDATLTTIEMVDKVYPFRVKAFYKAYNDIDIIETWTEISHQEKKPVVLKRFDSGHIMVRRGDTWLSHLNGNWASETSVIAEPLTRGMKVIKNTDGARNAHVDHPEIMISLDGKPQENTGRVVGAVLCWSGNYKLRIDTDNNFAHHLFAGINEEASEYRLEPKEVFTTPKLALTYSQEGIGGASRNYHRWARNGMVHNGKNTRDILLNSWEGVYFNIDEAGMEQMMADISYMGGELFVMDDGWFGGKYPRNNDSSSLGDWVVDTRKLPNGINGLLAAAEKNHVKFGIWIEPESMNKESELFEKHPEWALQVKNRPMYYGRGGTQVLLDLCNPKVQDFMFNLVDTLLSKYPQIAYIKWDANVDLKNYGSTYLAADKQSHVYIDYHRGLVSVLQRIREKYPDVVIQACGGGGGRANYGVMPYCEEFWVSDNTDALQRIFIQWGTSYFYPSVAMGQHVSAAPNHQTGRSLPLKFRFDVAMSGRLGMEIQPKNMTPEERDFAKAAIADYKTIRPVVQQGDLYRLVSPFDKRGLASLMYVTPDKNKAVFFCYKLEHYCYQVLPHLLMRGLDANKKYRIREVNPNKDDHCYMDGKTVSGALLMNTGFEGPLWREYASCILELTAVEE